MKVLVSGASGLIGKALTARLIDEGHEPLRLIRKPVRDAETEVRWTPSRGEIDREGVACADAVVHLSGRDVAAGRWNDSLKREMLESRVETTRVLAETLAGLAAENRGPRLLVCANATGYFGDRGEEELTDDSPPGDGFLADVCIDWQRAADPARDAGLRVVHTRLGPVLARNGGMLAKLTPVFRAGLGGTVGDGRQWFPWVHIEDVVSAILFALENENIAGPVNVVAPNPVRHKQFVKALARTLSRPAVIPVPAGLVKLALGAEMARDTVLASQKAHPARLLDAGFAFAYTHVEGALADCLR
ncbi:MAG: Epimerase family protein [Calditrichaeota bacterium]|nr:Epimerase family protein [Calditrichota bacterium]